MGKGVCSLLREIVKSKPTAEKALSTRFVLIRIVEGGVESHWVHSALRPLIGLLCPLQVIMIMVKLVE
jgi:hypothetical protein